MSRFTPVLLLASVGKLVLLDRDLERRRRRRRRPPVPETPDVVDLPEPEAPVEVLDPTEQLVLASWRAQGALG